MAKQIYRRLESPTQTKADAVEQTLSGEVWGRPHRINGNDPFVKAYIGPLVAGPKGRGIEFTTETVHDRRYSSPYEAKWYYPHTPGTFHRMKAGVDYAAIKAPVINKQP